MRERIIIVFIAIFIGLLVTTLVYFLYQQTKSIPSKTTNITRGEPTPTPASNVFLSITSPSDESLSDRRDIQVKGRTNDENIVVISTNQADVVVKPTADGAFTASVTIDAGSNKIITRAIAPNGDSAEDVRVVTFTTEEF